MPDLRCDGVLVVNGPVEMVGIGPAIHFNAAAWGWFAVRRHMVYTRRELYRVGTRDRNRWMRSSCVPPSTRLCVSEIRIIVTQIV